MGDFIKNSPFRFWCQKVLPLVYDDSLSYYELLCKVVGKLNELAENQNNLSDEIKAVAKDLNDFKNQVPDMVEAKVEEWLNNYIATHGLVNSVNGMTGEVTLTAADVGAIANVNGSVKNNNIAAGAVTADKLAAGVIPTKLPNPQKLTFSGAVTGEYDGSQAVNIDIPTAGGGGGGGAVDSVNGMTGVVVLKKLTAGEGLSMSGEDGYNGSAEQTVGIAPGGVSSDKIADNAITAQKIANDAVTADKIAGGAITSDKMGSGVIPTKLPNPQKLKFTGAVSAEYDGSQEIAVNIQSVPSMKYTSKDFTKTVGGTVVSFRVKYRPNIDFYMEFWCSSSIPIGNYKITQNLPSSPGDFIGTATLIANSNYCKVCGGCAFNTNGTTLTVNMQLEKADNIKAQVYMLYKSL